MKRKIMVLLIVLGIISAGAIAVSAMDDGEKGASKEAGKMELLSADEAKEIALKEVDGTVEEVELEREKNKVFYEVEIDKGNIDYTIHVDAYTGKILFIHEDVDDDDQKNTAGKTAGAAVTEKSANNTDDDQGTAVKTNPAQNQEKTEANSSAVTVQPASKKAESTKRLTKEQAIQIAKKAVKDPVIAVEEVESDDGKYEIELKTQKGEVEVKVHATSGKVLEIDYDDDYGVKAKKATSKKDRYDDDDDDDGDDD